jgi:hypothetical protein
MSLANAQTDFLDGCYETVEINGERIEPGPDARISQSSIFSVESEAYYALESREPLNTKVISVFKKFNGTWYTISNALMFEDLGELEVDGDSLKYSFENDVLYRNSYYALEKVDFKIFIKLFKENDLVKGSIRYASYRRGQDVDMNIVLKKAPCIAFRSIRILK